MTKQLSLILGIFLLGCGSSPATSDSAFLARCWGALPNAGGEYLLSFEAIDLAGSTEGGIYAHSSTCPDARLKFSSMPQDVDQQFRRAEEGAVNRAILGVGVRGRAGIVPLERANEFYLRVRITRLLSLERMSDADTRAFISRHHIG